MNFQSFRFHNHIATGISSEGFTVPTAIQARAIPLIIEGRDVMGLAQTGTGKTAAFVLPILERLMKGDRRGIRSLILAPTRELAEQTHQTIVALGRHTGLRSLSIYGGASFISQTEQLKKGVDIIVGCPGRLLDHIAKGSIDLSRTGIVVLDEADQMLDMGFLPDIRRILKHVPRKRQTLLFSATMPSSISKLAQEILADPVTVQTAATAPPATVSHALYRVDHDRKTALLLKILQTTETESVLVFTRTKHRAKRLGQVLEKAGYSAASLQGNLSQNRRRAALDGFRNDTFRILVATDIAARGIDVSQVTHVINYDIPDTAEAYIHRIGRTGRALRKGNAMTLVTSDDTPMIRTIERALGARLADRMVEGFN
jgi:ATP-dependent RNA helicase RhlE